MKYNFLIFLNKIIKIKINYIYIMNNDEQFIKRFFFDDNKLDYEQNYKYQYYENSYNNHFNSESNNIFKKIFNYFYELFQ